MELTELQKHDESKVTVFIFHSLAFFKFVWCNLNNKIFLKCFSFHGCKFSLTQFICFCQLIFNSYISILPFWSTVRWGRRGKECWQYNTDYSLGHPDWRCLITPSCTPSDWAAILCPLRPQTQTGCSRCLKQSWEII